MRIAYISAGASRLATCLLALAVAAAGAPGRAPAAVPASPAMLGGEPSRNLVSDARGLPSSWDVAAGRNVKWAVDLGTHTYAGPLAAGGMVLVGTNNQRPRDPHAPGDRGVLMAFAAADGAFLWQATHPKLAAGRAQDWPLEGLCSTPAFDGERFYYLSNSGEMIAVDRGGARAWTLDLIRQLGVVPHYMTASSPLVAGDLVYAVTGNGPDVDGRVPAPAAPSFIAVDRRNGKLRWSDASPGAGLLDGQWSSPAYGTLGGRPQVVFAGGDGWLYGFDPATGRRLWKFDANQQPQEPQPPPQAREPQQPQAPQPPPRLLQEAGRAPAAAPVPARGGRSRESLLATPVIHDGRVYIGLGHDPQKPPAAGRLWALRVGAGGDVAPSWSVGGDEFGTTLSAVAVADGVVYAAEVAGFLHALDAATGRELWKLDAQAAIWGSPLVADGKVYLGDEDGDLLVLAAGHEQKLLGKMSLGSAIFTAPAASEKVLYVATRDRLFALAVGASPKPP
jgi:outer membrane protein assembly factor BamB